MHVGISMGTENTVRYRNRTGTDPYRYRFTIPGTVPGLRNKLEKKPVPFKIGTGKKRDFPVSVPELKGFVFNCLM